MTTINSSLKIKSKPKNPNISVLLYLLMHIHDTRTQNFYMSLVVRKARRSRSMSIQQLTDFINVDILHTIALLYHDLTVLRIT